MATEEEEKGRNKFIWIVVILVIIGFYFVNYFNDTKNTVDYVIDESDFVNAQLLIENISESDLSLYEINGLILMREEEKLARDVYLVLYDKWNLKIFYNIANSEQTHTDSIKFLLDRYEIKDPVVIDDIGVFTSDELSNLYGDLIEKGSQSLLDALIVGATVEDLDINDLDNLLNTDNEDIKITYKNLQKGSRNHLRAYVRQIIRNGGSYSPVYISQENYESIISSSQERGAIF